MNNPTTLPPPAGRERGRSEAYVEREAVGEAQRAEEAEALAFRASAAVADNDGAAHHRRAAARGEDLRRGPARRLWLRLRQSYRSHRLGAGLRNGRPAQGAQGRSVRRWLGTGEAPSSESGRRRSIHASRGEQASLAKQVCFCIFFRPSFCLVASVSLLPARREGGNRRAGERGGDGGAPPPM